MSIDADWIWGLVGGLMIGTAAAVYLLINGRIMGASGILGSFVDGSGTNWERGAFLAGLVAAPLAYAATWGAPDTHVTSEPVLLILAGLAVGFGTRLANGCTSGHGVCGISRFSRRGIAATASFLIAGMLAMYLGRHVLGLF